jgi:hypothetical protein
LVLDYTGGSSPLSTVRADLLSGLIHDSTKATPIPGGGLVTLGYTDHTTLSQILIRPALAGDANLDGAVDGGDFTLLKSNWGKSGEYWSDGDFNYDGVIDGADFTILKSNWGKTWYPTFTMALGDIAGLSVTNVPEPSSFIMLATLLSLGGAWGLARRRRNHVA